ncbi:MAG: RNA 2',3'-cyclic phosphodiesterase [Nitrospirae bacterium]|nr:RNA 2',3'-cyclic phosphodiesterase [Nitrospirota bacterium]
MRCFIALEVSEEVRHSIARAIEAVKGLSRNVRWIPPDHIHLTLKFLGEVSDAMAIKIEEQLAMLCRRHGPFVITVSGTGGFPSLRRPNVLWAGIDKSGPLTLLHRDIEQSMAGLGFGMENRPFSPHLTVARVKSSAGLEDVIREWLKFKDAVFGTVTVAESLLMKSTLKPDGAEYSRLAGFKLAL